MRPASMASALSQPPSSDCRPKSPNDTVLPRVALPFTRPRWFFRNFTRLGMSGMIALLGGPIFPVVDPHLDADVPLRRVRLRKPELHARAQRGQGDAAEHVGLLPGHLRSPQPARQLDPDPLR